jgi:hypothetical protein
VVARVENVLNGTFCGLDDASLLAIVTHEFDLANQVNASIIATEETILGEQLLNGISIISAVGFRADDNGVLGELGIGLPETNDVTPDEFSELIQIGWRLSVEPTDLCFLNEKK